MQMSFQPLKYQIEPRRPFTPNYFVSWKKPDTFFFLIVTVQVRKKSNKIILSQS